MSKICKHCKNLKGKKLEKYIEMIGDWQYICEKCGRVAEDKKHLCYPVKIHEKSLKKDKKQP